MNKAEMIQKTHTDFSHRHWCEVEGHEYECSGDCICICGLPMNGNDHSDCPVELRPCPEHSMPEVMSEINLLSEEQDAAPPHCLCGCSEIDLNRVVGWCLHCNHVYANYTPEVENRHFANHCPGVPEAVREAALARLAKRARP